MRSGQMVLVLSTGVCLRLDSAGVEQKRFQIGSATIGGLEVLADGHLLLTKRSNRVVEFDPDGKLLWQVNLTTPSTATRLPGGNTLIAALQGLVIEVDSAGRTVWEHKISRPWRARRY
jgi:outer membrane protein assembly factor BamB